MIAEKVATSQLVRKDNTAIFMDSGVYGKNGSSPIIQLSIIIPHFNSGRLLAKYS